MKRISLLILISALFVYSVKSQTIYTFTNAGAQGSNGPTAAQITAAYTGTTLDGLVNQAAGFQGIQEFVVPASGTYRIEAIGATGGNQNETNISVGRPARISCEFELTAGTRLFILVGQHGFLGSTHPNGAFDGEITIKNGVPVSRDCSSFAVAGERNRVVIVQFDSCPTGNNLIADNLNVNGTVVPVDNTAPPVAIAQDITVALGSDGSFVLEATQVDNGSFSATAGPVTLSLDDTYSFSCADNGFTTAVTLIVTDANGDQSTATANVTVTDNEAPSITVQDVTVELDANRQASIASSPLLLDVFTEDFTADAPGVRNVLVNWDFGNAGDHVDLGDYIANNNSNEIDLAGDNNSTITSKQTLVLSPGDYQLTFDNRLNNNPSGGNSVRVILGSLLDQTYGSQLSGTQETATFSVAQNTSVNLTFEQLGNDDAAGSFIGNIRLAQVIAPSYSVITGASDNCGVASVAVQQSNFTCADLGQNTIEVSVTDNNDNVETVLTTVTVVDNISPVVSVNGSATVQHEAFTPYTDAGASALDNCDVNLVTYNPVNVNALDVYTVTYTATDAAGNQTVATRSVEIIDTTAPTVITQDVTVQLDANGNASIVASDIVTLPKNRTGINY